MAPCIFCDIVSGKMPSVKVWEDRDYLAILDINPNVRGLTLVLTKRHYDSYAFDMDDNAYSEYMKAAKKVAGRLEKGLKVQRVAMVMEGLGINHAHIKLYPIHGINGKFEESWAKDRVYFDNYEGYISTQLGPQRSMTELEAVANEISENAGD